MIPLYILGMLLRYGPQHGYQIKKMISEQLSDFTDIKLPAIYYHLEKMEAGGLITAQAVKEGVRPEKRVYAISEAGVERFQQLLRRTLDLQYRPSFEVDSALFFSDYTDDAEFLLALECHVSNLNDSLQRIASHRQEVVPNLPSPMRSSADLIFAHHELHYQAERSWAERAIQILKEDTSHDKTEGD